MTQFAVKGVVYPLVAVALAFSAIAVNPVAAHAASGIVTHFSYDGAAGILPTGKIVT